MDEDESVEVSMNIPFPSTREAAIAYDVLRVDSEPKRSGVTKTLTVERNSLKVTFTSKGAKQLRVAVHSFVDYLVLISETMAQFGPARMQFFTEKPFPEKFLEFLSMALNAEIIIPEKESKCGDNETFVKKF